MLPINFLTLKITSLYVAYAPEFEVSAFGACQDEALNNFTDEIRERQSTAAKLPRKEDGYSPC